MSPSTLCTISRPRFIAPLLAIATLATAAAAQNCDRASTGVLPLDDLRDGSYLGFEGGLYPGGVNRCPPAHQAAGEAIAARIVPLDAAGLPAADGRVVVASLGFSLASMPFVYLIQLAATDPRVAAAVTLANCAFPGKDVTELADPDSDYWATTVPGQLALAGATAEQVQVAWLLVGDRVQALPFPGHVDDLEAKFVAITRNARAAFPHLRLCFVSSLPWLGYSVAPEGSEPYYFEQGFAQKRLI